MNIGTRFFSAAHAFRHRLPRRSTIAALCGGIALATGLSACAVSHGAGGHHGMAANASPADVANHIDLALKHVYAEIGATDAQKAQLEPIVKQAAADLMPLHTQLHAAHKSALSLFTQDSIDRAAIEAARAQNMQIIDQATKRVAQLFADVAEVLTPAQRKSLADHVARMHG